MYLFLEGLLLAALAGSTAFAVASFPGVSLGTPDFYWHLKVGEWIALNRAIPRTEFFSWSAPGLPWVAHEWLSELIFYGSYRWLGMRGLVLLGAASLGVLYWFVARYLKIRRAAFFPIHWGVRRGQDFPGLWASRISAGR